MKKGKNKPRLEICGFPVKITNKETTSKNSLCVFQGKNTKDNNLLELTVK